MDIEPLCLVARETAGDGLKRPADLIEMVSTRKPKSVRLLEQMRCAETSGAFHIA